MFKTFLNTYFDHFYYDVGTVSEADQRQLPELSPRPWLLRVQPCGRLVAHHSLEEMKAAGLIPQVFALPGAVSASLGAAALGRNLAEALAEDVCVLVPGALNSGWCEQFLAWLPLAKPRQCDVLLAILRDPQIQVSHLVGHSKGCADLAWALGELEQSGWPAHWDPTIITIGGVVRLPGRLAKVHQLLGEYDWLGYCNSRIDLHHERIAGSGHHLNRQLPFHFDVVRELRERT